MEIKEEQLSKSSEQQLKGADRHTEELHTNASFCPLSFQVGGRVIFPYQFSCTARNRRNNKTKNLGQIKVVNSVSL